MRISLSEPEWDLALEVLYVRKDQVLHEAWDGLAMASRLRLEWPGDAEMERLASEADERGYRYAERFARLHALIAALHDKIAAAKVPAWVRTHRPRPARRKKEVAR